MTSSTLPVTAARSLLRPGLPGRLPVALIAGVGGGAVVVGAFLPWLSTFAGLIQLRGVAGPNGRALAALGAGALLVALWWALRGGNGVRLALGGLGAAATGLAGYLLISLLHAYSAMHAGMMLARLGPGLFVAAGGAVAVFGSLFVPAPTADDRAQPPADRGNPVDVVTWTAGIAAIVAGLAHVPLISEHWREVPYLGVAFLLFAVASCVGGVTLLRVDDRRLWAALGLLNVAAIVAYVVSRSIGLPLAGGDVGNWLEPLGVVAVPTEALVVALAAVRLRLPAGRVR